MSKRDADVDQPTGWLRLSNLTYHDFLLPTVWLLCGVYLVMEGTELVPPNHIAGYLFVVYGCVDMVENWYVAAKHKCYEYVGSLRPLTLVVYALTVAAILGIASTWSFLACVLMALLVLASSLHRTYMVYKRKQRR